MKYSYVSISSISILDYEGKLLENTSFYLMGYHLK